MRKYTLIASILIILILSACSAMKKTQSGLTGNWTFVDIQMKKANDKETKSSTEIVKELIKDSYIKFIDLTNVEMKISSDKTSGKWSVSNDGKRVNVISENNKETETFDIIELTSEKLVLSYASENNEDGTVVIMSFKK
ncbi:MAG: hypothetical protein GY756_02475 [bacterium]|nr:hypothetical protein [bacterium]